MGPDLYLAFLPLLGLLGSLNPLKVLASLRFIRPNKGANESRNTKEVIVVKMKSRFTFFCLFSLGEFTTKK
jgi:hypothetical protein